MPHTSHLGLFEAIGVELEYMIVDQDRLATLPVCDRILTAEAGSIVSDVEFDDISWSNELVLHVIELKTTNPVAELKPLSDQFQQHVHRVNTHLASLAGRLMPTAMHPWMNPANDTHLWPHDCGTIYKAFDRIFGCSGHGWANLQSLHINLPFADDQEFGRLHAAVRLLLPIIPAIAASSPIVEGHVTGPLDNRLIAYRSNSQTIPSIAGHIVPEPVFTKATYQKDILERIYGDLAPYDAPGVLRYEWVNARGAIARFDRDTIEIRLIDTQECPAADIAIVAAVVAVLKLIVAETWSSLVSQQSWSTETLASILHDTTIYGEATTITNTAYLETLGFSRVATCTAGELWQHLIDAADKHLFADLAGYERELEIILRKGPLARRILRATEATSAPGSITDVYRRLCDCLAEGKMFMP